LLDIEKIRDEIKEKLKNPTLFKNTSDLIGDGTGKENDIESLSENDLEDENEEIDDEEIENEDEEDFSSDLDGEETEDDELENN